MACQVATSYIINSSYSSPEPNSLLQYPVTPSIKQNLIDDSSGPASTMPISKNNNKFSSNSESSKFYKRIVWRKDGEKLIGDAVFNIRLVDFKFIIDRILKMVFINKNLCFISSTPGWLISRLSILSAERSHSGSYSCSISNSTAAVVDVQILNGICFFITLIYLDFDI